jgi:hypothetical protein
MLMKGVGNPANEMALVGMERDLAPADLKAARTGIGAALRTLHSDVLREEVPDSIAELVRQLDQQLRQLDQQKDPTVRSVCKYGRRHIQKREVPWWP